VDRRDGSVAGVSLAGSRSLSRARLASTGYARRTPSCYVRDWLLVLFVHASGVDCFRLCR
jgi:hypothetical protein